MRTTHWMLGLGQLGEQPLDLCRLQRHIDLDRRMARDGRRNSRPQSRKILILLWFIRVCTGLLNYFA